MANPDKLNSKIDLKNIDVNQLVSILSEHQVTLINLGLIIGSLLLVGGMFNDNRVKAQGIRLQMSQVQDKLVAIKSRDAAAKDLDKFKSSLPKRLNEFELTTLISNYAKLYHVSIPSLSPAESVDMGLYDAINVKFDASADNFKNMMLFLRQIEKSEYPLRINSWSGHELENGTIFFDIEVSAILIHQ